MVLMTDDPQTLREQSRDWCQIGTFDFKLLPHYPGNVGPRVWFLIKGTPVFCLDARSSHLLTPEQARLLANRLKIAADEAEAMQRRMQRHKPVADEIPTTTTMEKSR
jgi:hypothetical protein